MEHTSNINVNIPGLLEYLAALHHLERRMSELTDKVAVLATVVADLSARVDASNTDVAAQLAAAQAALTEAQRVADAARNAELDALAQAAALRAQLDAVTVDDSAAVASLDSSIATIGSIGAPVVVPDTL